MLRFSNHEGRVFCRFDGILLKGFSSGWRVVRKLAEANIKALKGMIGHNEIKMTYRYTHLTDAQKSALWEKLANHYNALNPIEDSKSLTESFRHWEETLGNIKEHRTIFLPQNEKISRWHDRQSTDFIMLFGGANREHLLKKLYTVTP